MRIKRSKYGGQLVSQEETILRLFILVYCRRFNGVIIMLSHYESPATARARKVSRHGTSCCGSGCRRCRRRVERSDGVKNLVEEDPVFLIRGRDNGDLMGRIRIQRVAVIRLVLRIALNNGNQDGQHENEEAHFLRIENKCSVYEIRRLTCRRQ